MTATLQITGNPAFTLPSVSEVLRRIWPQNTRKHVSRAFGVPWGTARDWVEEKSCPRVDKVLEVARSDRRARAAFQKVLEEIDYAERRLAEMAGQGVLPFGCDLGPSSAMAQPARGPARSAAIRRAA